MVMVMVVVLVIVVVVEGQWCNLAAAEADDE